MGTRVSGWELAMQEELARAAPFAWGQSDCCQFVRRMVRAITGQDFGAELAYATQKEAYGIVRQYGGLARLVSRYLGDPIAASYAGRGDVVLLKAPSAMLGICCGHVVAAQAEDGLIWVPLGRASLAWRV